MRIASRFGRALIVEGALCVREVSDVCFGGVTEGGDVDRPDLR